MKAIVMLETKSWPAGPGEKDRLLKAGATIQPKTKEERFMCAQLVDRGYAAEAEIPPEPETDSEAEAPPEPETKQKQAPAKRGAAAKKKE